MKKLTLFAVGLPAAIVAVHQRALYQGANPHDAAKAALIVAVFVTLVANVFDIAAICIGLTAIIAACVIAVVSGFCPSIATIPGITCTSIACTVITASTITIHKKLRVPRGRVTAVLAVEGLTVYLSLTLTWLWVFPGVVFLVLLHLWFWDMENPLQTE